MDSDESDEEPPTKKTFNSPQKLKPKDEENHSFAKDRVRLPKDKYLE